MVDKSKETYIELKEINKDDSLTNIVRKTFRISVSIQHKFFIVIDQTTYPIADINSLGIGISLESDKIFQVGQIFAGCEVTFDNEVFKGLKGEVIHCSPDRENSWLYGIKWLNLDGKTIEKINRVMQRLKEELFKKDDTEIDNGPEL